ncbi:MAG: hypothetical protein AAGC68_15730, partial [Verrucomicrobiota bacterium]
MKVLLTISQASRITGGAAISCAALLKNLERDFGHECRLLTRSPLPVQRVISGVEVTQYQDLEELKSIVESW